MTSASLDQFLALPWPEGVRRKLTDLAGQPRIKGLLACRVGDTLAATAFDGPLPDPLPDNTVATWRRKPQPKPRLAVSRTMQAVALVREGKTPHAAATKLGISAAAVYRALAREQGKLRCPCCGQPIRSGAQLDRSQLRDPAAGSAGA